MFNAPERVTEPGGTGAAGTWEQAVATAAAGLAAAGPGKVAAIVGDASNEEGYLVQRIVREALGSPHLDSRVSRGPGRAAQVRLAQPELTAQVREIDEADAILLLGTDPLHSSPILDLRIRKAMRRNGTRLVLATERPTTLDGGADAIARFAPGEAGHLLAELGRALGGEENVATPLAGALRDAGVGGEEPKRVVVIWGERVAHEGEAATAALLDLAAALDLGATEGSGMLEVPELANARGLREAGCLPDAGPGLTEVAAGRSTEEIREGLIAGEIEALILFGVDPIRDFPDTRAGKSALQAAYFVISFSTFESDTTAISDVTFPLETHAEKDGTVTHPDGRLQRVRPSAGRPGDIRPNWGTLAALALELGLDTGITSQPSAFTALCDAAPIYSGLTDLEIGGRGIRWQDRPAASMRPTPEDQGDVGGPSERFAESAPTASADSQSSPGRSRSE
jgi:NADH-quinone oxidoreductase subunit G